MTYRWPGWDIICLIDFICDEKCIQVTRWPHIHMHARNMLYQDRIDITIA